MWLIFKNLQDTQNIEMSKNGVVYYDIDEKSKQYFEINKSTGKISLKTKLDKYYGTNFKVSFILKWKNNSIQSQV